MPGFVSPGDRVITKVKKPQAGYWLIAECGSNHNGDLDRAKNLIAHAARAGATHAKFQLWRPQWWYSKRAMPEQYAKVSGLVMPSHWLPDLAEECRNVGVGFLCTAFDEYSLAAVDAYVEAHKIASGDIDNVPLLRAAAQTGRPILLSTGAATMEEVQVAHNSLDCVRLTVLHCVSSYPTPTEQANLGAIADLKRTYKHVGYSDHTTDPYACLAAYCLGARVFEVHFDLSDRQGIEAGHSVTGDTLGFIRQGLNDLSSKARFVTATERGIDPHWTLHFPRVVRLLAQNGKKEPMLCEVSERGWARRGIYTSRPVKKGEPLTGVVRALRPACAVGGGPTPVSVSEWDEVVSARAARSLDGDVPVTEGDLVWE